MLRIIEKLANPRPAAACMTLPYELRQRSRFKATLDDGREVGVFLPRGGILRGGDCLLGEDGLVVLVQAAAEAVTTAYAGDAKSLAEAVYHLGNRHVPLQIGDQWLRYGHDHVLDELVVSLGLRVNREQAPFEPLAGAYAGHSHGGDAHRYVHVRHG